VLYIVHFTAFCLGGPFFSGHGVDSVNCVPVAEAGDDEGRTTQDLLLSDVPRHRDHVRRLVTLRPH